jgi:hypothetical protein
MNTAIGERPREPRRRSKVAPPAPPAWSAGRCNAGAKSDYRLYQAEFEGFVRLEIPVGRRTAQHLL